MIASLLLAIALSTVQGRVEMDDTPIPGCTVWLKSERSSRVAISGHDGSYRFAGVPHGSWELRVELEGFVTHGRQITVADEQTEIPAIAMEIEPVIAEFTITCGFAFDPTASDDHVRDSTLIEAARGGDGSAVLLLRQRLDAATSIFERDRLIGELLRKTCDDAELWNELAERASIAVRFANGIASEEYLQWCAARDLDPNRYWSESFQALEIAGRDPRSRELLRRALASETEVLVQAAIRHLAAQRDVDALPLIDAAIAKVQYERCYYARLLAAFHDDRADAIAMKYLTSDDVIASYRAERAQPQP